MTYKIPQPSIIYYSWCDEYVIDECDSTIRLIVWYGKSGEHKDARHVCGTSMNV